MSGETHQRTWTLIDAWCQGTLSPEGLMQLRAALADDAAARRLFIEYMDLNTQLIRQGQVARDVSEIVATVTEVAATASAQPAQSPAKLPATADPRRAELAGQSLPSWLGGALALSIDARHHPLRFALSIGVTTCLLWLGFAIAVLPWQSAKQDHSHTAVRQPHFAPSPVVARVGKTEAATWARGQQVGSGSLLRQGESLELKSGQAELCFRDGAVVVLEGPARFQVLSTGSGRIEFGKLTARVQPAARGFSVTTAWAKIVDLGTEFAAAVSPEGFVDVHVFSGDVSIEPADQATANFDPQRLEAGQSLRIHSQAVHGSAIQAIPHSPKTHQPPKQIARASQPSGSIGINFTLGPPDSLAPNVAAGLLPGTRWNNVAAEASGDNRQILDPWPGLLIDATGASSDVKLEWRATGGYRFGALPAGTAGPNQLFAAGLVGSDDHGEIHLTLSEIPYDVYDMYVFVSNYSELPLSLRCGEQQYFYTSSSKSQLVMATAKTPPGTPGANYVVFRNLRASTLELLSTGSLGGVVSNNVHGLHIVQRTGESQSHSDGSPVKKEK